MDSYISIAALYRLLLLICLDWTSALKVSEEAFWMSYFSQGSTHHQLSSSEDRPLKSTSGIISSPNYPSNFTFPASSNQRYRIIIEAVRYRNIEIFYNKERFSECTNLKERNQIGFCVSSSSGTAAGSGGGSSGGGSSGGGSSGGGSAGGNKSVWDLITYSTNYSDVIITFTSSDQTHGSFAGFKFYYQLFTSSNSLLDTDPPIYLPTIIAMSNDFPSTDHSSGQLLTLRRFHLNVALYKSVTIKLLLADVGNASCDITYLMMNGDKICQGNSNMTIKVQEHYTNLTLRYESKVAYEGVGMLAEITGISKDVRVDICTMSSMVVYSSGAVQTYSIGSPGYPFPNSYKVNDCHIKLEGFDLVTYAITGYIAANCSATQLEIGKSKRCGLTNNSEVMAHWGPPLLVKVKYTQLTSAPVPPFSIDFTLYTFYDICQYNSVEYSKQITSFPIHLRSPRSGSGATGDQYPADTTCLALVNVSSVTRVKIEFKKLDLEISTKCQHDTLTIGTPPGYCGSDLSGQSVFAQVSSIFPIHFKSDALHTGAGFAIIITDATPHLTTTTTSAPDPVTTTTTTPAPSPVTTTTTTSAPYPVATTMSTSTTSEVKPSTLTSPNVTLPTVPQKGITTKEAAITKKSSGQPLPPTTSQSLTKPDSRKSKGVPSYVWGIVIPVIVVMCAVAVIVIVRRRKRPVVAGYGNITAMDMGYENPTYGQGE